MIDFFRIEIYPPTLISSFFKRVRLLRCLLKFSNPASVIPPHLYIKWIILIFFLGLQVKFKSDAFQFFQRLELFSNPLQHNISCAVTSFIFIPEFSFLNYVEKLSVIISSDLRVFTFRMRLSKPFLLTSLPLCRVRILLQEDSFTKGTTEQGFLDLFDI